MPPLIQAKIDTFLIALNAGHPGLWVELPGTHALMKVQVGDTGVFYPPNIGFVVKGFLNTQTGEVKTFNARIFT